MSVKQVTGILIIKSFPLHLTEEKKAKHVSLQ